MEINRRIAKATEKIAKEAISKAGILENILPRIKPGVVIPIISSSFRVEQIFREGGASADVEEGALSLNEQLVSAWAHLIEYPMQDKHNMARVAQYYLVEQKDAPYARTKYFEFLKSFLLTITSEDKDYADLALRLKTRIQEMSFSEIVHQLDYPRFPDGSEDPLRLLARLPLKVYITTSQSDFIERALEAEGKKPRAQICFWSGEISSTSPEHRPDPEFIPTEMNPLVYHLYGMEEYPQTLVLSEDDYLEFLTALAEDTNMLNPIVPLSLRRALGESTVMLLGYCLADWDFRVLFRFIQKYRREGFSPRGMVIQLRRNERAIENVEKSVEYLRQYFENQDFDIAWKDTEQFIQMLWNAWNEHRQAQS